MVISHKLNDFNSLYYTYVYMYTYIYILSQVNLAIIGGTYHFHTDPNDSAEVSLNLSHFPSKVGRASAQLPWNHLTGPQYEKKARESCLKMAIFF